MKVHLQPQKDYWDRNNHSGSHEDIKKIQEELMLLCQDRNKLINKEPTKLMLIPELMKQAGWRHCAEGQKTTQYCGMAEQARLEEREACAIAAKEFADYLGEDGRRYAEAVRNRGNNDPN